jgi:hypothetical protein
VGDAIVELRSKPNFNSSRIIVDFDTRFTRCDRVKKWLRALVGCLGRPSTPHLILYLSTWRTYHLRTSPVLGDGEVKIPSAWRCNIAAAQSAEAWMLRDKGSPSPGWVLTCFYRVKSHRKLCNQSSYRGDVAPCTHLRVELMLSAWQHAITVTMPVRHARLRST